MFILKTKHDEEINKLRKAHVEEYNSLVLRFKQLQQTIYQQQQDLAKARLANQQLQNGFESLQKKWNNSLRAERLEETIRDLEASARAQLKNKEKIRADFENERIVIEKYIGQKTAIHSQLEQKNHQLSEQLNEQKKRWAILQAEYDQRRSDLTKLQVDCDARQALLTELKKSIETIKTEIQEVHIELGAKKKSLQGLEDSYTRLQVDKLTLEKATQPLKEERGDQILMAILESDLRAGYLCEWAAEIFKRVYRKFPERAQTWLLEARARHPHPKKFEFQPDNLELLVDGTPVEQLFAAMIADHGGKSSDQSLEDLVRVWERYLHLSSQQ